MYVSVPSDKKINTKVLQRIGIFMKLNELIFLFSILSCVQRKISLSGIRFYFPMATNLEQWFFELC